MTRDEYFEGLKALAREKRMYHAVRTNSFGLREVRQIYKKEGIRIDPWPLPPKIKAMYMCADGDYSVAVQRSLPDEPKLFALVHELKHHYVDQEQIANGVVTCGDYNRNELIEKGAEVFAAEFIFPEQEFAELVKSIGISVWRPEDIVRLKRRIAAKISYTFVRKRLERLGLVTRGAFVTVQFKKLEEQMFGVPYWKARMRRRAVG
ncbi:ImmA/IrrE family metallo-endopeptidase [Bradyrhizobium yuanmingense]|uniref:Zn-dependent peptidase ImmA (M78 family) n=1 Tax=Bradyrhizobium yuanmingense TaxID=108015 RepID=A0ABV4GBL1_9BRAD|nr:ImmA/IrrE family metallo-endopeptidase [Bradyrhizobium yuanmingense]